MGLELECLVDFAGTAEWRRRKAEEFPHDTRNAEAAEILDKLAEEAKLLKGSAIHKRLLDLSLTKEDVGFSILVSGGCDGSDSTRTRKMQLSFLRQSSKTP